MKARDVVIQLANLLPQRTGLFTSEVAVSSVVRSGTLMTVTCAQPHGLAPGNTVAIAGAVMPIVISTFVRSGTVGTITTAADHDLTGPVAPTVETSGAVEPNFNGTHEVIKVLNRRTITVRMADSGATTATGSPILRNAESFLRKYDGTHAVSSVVNPTTFTFVHPITTLSNPVQPLTGTIVARTKPRISAVVDVERAIASLTEREDLGAWLFVVLEDVVASKLREIGSDAIANIPRNLEFRQQMIQPFTVYAAFSVSETFAGREARDAAEELFPALCKSLLFSKFDSGFYVGKQGTVHSTGHGYFRYDSSTYVHRFGFEQVCDLTFDDSVGHDDDVAFRDIDLEIFPDLPGGAGTGIEKLEGTMSLDEQPL